MREKVFLDRYALKDRDGKAIETAPEDMWRRVAKGIAAVEPTPGEAGVLERAVLRGLERLQVRAGGPHPGRRRHGHCRHLLQLLRHPFAGGTVGAAFSTTSR